MLEIYSVQLDLRYARIAYSPRYTELPMSQFQFYTKDDSFGQYLERIGKYPVLTQEEEFSLGSKVRAQVLREQQLQELAAAGHSVVSDAEKAAALEITEMQWRRGVKEFEWARDKLMTHNIRLVVHIAKRYKNRGLIMEDLVSEGCLGLSKAVLKFKPELGYKFSTYACVPTSTKILTRRGWVSWNEIEKNDQTIGYNLETGLAEWTPIRAVSDYQDAPLLEFGDGRWSTLCTPNHKWLMQDATGISLRPIEEWPQGGEMSRRKSGMSLIISAPFKGGDSPLTADEAALLGWLHSDGQIIWRKGDPTKLDGGYIFQTKAKFVSEIEELLARLRVLKPGTPHNKCGDCLKFWVPGATLRPIWEKAGLHKRSLYDLMFDLSPAARKSFIDAWYMADGTQGRNNICDGFGPKFDALELCLLLEGKNCLRRRIKTTESCGILSWRDKPLAARRTLVKEAGSGHVWCPTTDLGTWTAMDEQGNIYVTGNTWWIRQAITRAIAQQSKTIRVPLDVAGLINKVRLTINRLMQQNGRAPTLDELAVYLEKDKSKIQQALIHERRTLSLNESFWDGEGVVEEEHKEETLYTITAEFIQEHILTHLDQTERHIVVRKFGLDGKEPTTYKDLATELGISITTVRKCKDSAFAKIQTLCIEQGLIDHSKQIQTIYGYQQVEEHPGEAANSLPRDRVPSY